jgi:peptide/nickel transport system substrate-binding protein
LRTVLHGRHPRPAVHRVLHGHGPLLSLSEPPTKGVAPKGAALFFVLAITAAAAPCGTAIIPNGIGLGSPAAPTGLNPVIGTTTNLQTGLLLYRPLVWPGPDAREDTSRSLAAAIEALDNNTRFRVTLKAWRWSDGTPITADDVLFGWQQIVQLGPDIPAYGQGGIPTRVKSVTVTGPAQVDFLLTQSTNPDWFRLNGLSIVYPLPRHAMGNPTARQLWERQTDPDAVRVVDGPFQLSDFRLDRYAAYAPNPNYDGPKPHLARLVVTFLEGASPLHEVEAGDADLAIVPPTVWTRLRPGPGRHTVVLPEPYGYDTLAPNLRNPDVAFFRDPALRRALAKAIDQQAIIRLVHHGLAGENHVPLPVAADRWRSPATHAGDTDLVFDPDAAATILRRAGWHPGPDGIRAKNGQRLSFTLMSGAPSDDAPEMQELLMIQRDLREIGVEMRLHRVGWDIMIATLADPTAWDAAMVPESVPAVPDGAGLLDTGGGSNYGGYSDARMDALIAATTTAPGTDALFAYQDYAAEQEPWIILPQGQLPLLVADRLHGVEQFSSPLGYWEPEELWVEDGACHAPGAETLR